MAEFVDLPDITFAEEDAAKVLGNIVAIYEGLTKRFLQPADPVRLFLSSLATIIVQQRVLINRTAKSNYLRYAKGVALDHMGAFQGSQRLAPSRAITTMEFRLSMPLPSATSIPAGTRVSPDGGDGSIYFSTTEYIEIPAGATAAVVVAECSVPGTVGNGYLPGQITALMDPLPFVQGARNTSESSGGAAEESDDVYRERIRTASDSFSTAGPRGAYEFWARSASAVISDVHAYSPSEGKVVIVPLMTGGQLPTQNVLDAVSETLEERGIRPLTDQVTVIPPTPVSYKTKMTYYISRDRAADATSIQAAVAAAVESYHQWQRAKLGRDINPSELIARVMTAGALRVVVTSPVYAEIAATQVAQEQPAEITYGGLVDD